MDNENQARWVYFLYFIQIKQQFISSRDFILCYFKFHTMPCRALKFSTAECVTQHCTLKSVTSHSIRINKSFKYLIDSSNREFRTPVVQKHQKRFLYHYCWHPHLLSSFPCLIWGHSLTAFYKKKVASYGSKMTILLIPLFSTKLISAKNWRHWESMFLLLVAELKSDTIHCKFTV